MIIYRIMKEFPCLPPACRQTGQVGFLPSPKALDGRSALTKFQLAEVAEFTIMCSLLPMAERARFELANPCGLHAFQACALDHYATSPP